jgi:Tol biopolymer transport system component
VAEYGPAWSPDGQPIAFLRHIVGWDVEVMVMPALGGGARRIGAVRLAGAPIDQLVTTYLSWTPDSRAVVAGGDVDEQPGIWRFDVDGLAPTRLTTPPPGRSDWQPVYASDFRRLAFVRRAAFGKADLWVQPLDEGGSPDGAPSRLLAAWPSYVGDVDWGAEGRSLIFSTGSAMESSRLKRLPLMPDRLAAASPPEPLAIGDQATGLDVSPTGRIAYVQRLRDTGFMALDLDNPVTGLQPFAGPASSLDEDVPAYSPDGTQLTFASTRSGTQEIWIANLDGSGARQMTTMGGPMTFGPDWSPDGRRIVFHSMRAGTSDLYLLDVATAGIQRLTSWPGTERFPSWSPDGRWIYFGAEPLNSRMASVYRMPAGGGPAERIVDHGDMPVATPDGAWLYVIRVPGLWKVPVTEGATSEGTQVLEAVCLNGTNFVVGTRATYALARSPASHSPCRVVAIDHASGRVTTLAPQMGRPWNSLALSPDERTLLVTVSFLRDGIDLMVADPVP